MNITCDQLDNLLFEGDRLSLETAERHAAGCPECRETLDAWSDLSGTARTLQADWGSDLLWPRIERALREEKRASRGGLWRIAAAVVLTAGLAGGTFFAVQKRERAAFDREILPVAAFDDVERAEEQHVAAIGRLETLAERPLESDEPLMVSYKEKLMLLDDAIAECQANIERNRNNAHLRRQLLTMYTDKQRTLQDVVREGTHEKNR
ncbi:MAG TPA: hypothetical protein VGF69_13675 [Thermoanaerobaculia bacterium]|jgi:hypothetical protein